MQTLKKRLLYHYCQLYLTGNAWRCYLSVSGRSDDNLETIKKRLEIYEEKTAPVNDFYKGLNKYYAINGIGQIEEIFGRISEVIDSTK